MMIKNNFLFSKILLILLLIFVLYIIKTNIKTVKYYYNNNYIRFNDTPGDITSAFNASIDDRFEGYNFYLTLRKYFSGNSIFLFDEDIFSVKHLQYISKLKPLINHSYNHILNKKNINDLKKTDFLILLYQPRSYVPKIWRKESVGKKTSLHIPKDNISKHNELYLYTDYEQSRLYLLNNNIIKKLGLQ